MALDKILAASIDDTITANVAGLNIGANINLTTSSISVGNSTVNSFINSSSVIITGPVKSNYSLNTGNTAAFVASGGNTIGGTGYFDFLIANNTSASATGKKWFRLDSTGIVQIINSGYSASIFNLTDAGNFSVGGTITPGAYTAGQVIKDTMLSNSEVTIVSTTIGSTGSNVNFVTYNYTPVSSSSYLIVHFHLSKYQPQGTTDDSWYSVLAVDGAEIAYGWQMVNDNNTGTSGRSGVLFPLTGRYTNSSTSAKQIQVAARRDAADDSIIIDNSETSMWLRITEIAR